MKTPLGFFRSGRSTRTASVVFILFILFWLFYPFQTTIVPEWSLKVVDEEGAVVRDVNVTEHWQHFLLESSSHEERPPGWGTRCSEFSRKDNPREPCEKRIGNSRANQARRLEGEAFAGSVRRRLGQPGICDDGGSIRSFQTSAIARDGPNDQMKML